MVLATVTVMVCVGANHTNCAVMLVCPVTVVPNPPATWLMLTVPETVFTLSSCVGLKNTGKPVTTLGAVVTRVSPEIETVPATTTVLRIVTMVETAVIEEIATETLTAV